MENQAVINNKEWIELNTKVNDNSTKFDFIVKAMEEIKNTINAMNSRLDKLQSDLRDYRSDMGDTVARMSASLEDKIEKSEIKICDKIGEIPSGQTVMSCVRCADEKINRLYWIFGLVTAGIGVLSNLQGIISVFK